MDAQAENQLIQDAYGDLDRTALIANNRELIKQNHNLQHQIDQFQHQLDQLKRMIFGQRSERHVTPNPRQLTLGEGLAPTASDAPPRRPTNHHLPAW